MLFSLAAISTTILNRSVHARIFIEDLANLPTAKQKVGGHIFPPGVVSALGLFEFEKPDDCSKPTELHGIIPGTQSTIILWKDQVAY